MKRKHMMFSSYIKALIFGFITTMVLNFTLWSMNIYAVHSILESLSLFVGAATFLIVWNSMNEIPDMNHFLGISILAVVIFDACYIYLFAVPLKSITQTQNFSFKLWILARLTEAIILYIMSLKKFYIKPYRWSFLVAAITLPIIISSVLIKYPHILPAVYTETGFTLFQKIFSAIIIFFTVLTLRNVNRIVEKEDSMTWSYYFVALLIIITAQVMFIITGTIFSINIIYGHVLKIIYYYYLYKSVFVSYVKYPYKLMENKNEKLEKAYKELEQKKEEESRTQAVMLQQEKLALLGQMGAGIVHETRNYLTTIKGSCQIMKLITEDEKILRYVKKINRSVDEIDNIISKFLYMSKPRDTEFEEISIHELGESIKSLLASTMIEKCVDVHYEIAKEDRYILCDEGQINQVVLNLCKNAVEAMEEVKNPKLSIKIDYDEKKNQMYISVIDNGKGISPDDISKIGNAFYTTKKAGTGLGLYLCRQIVKEHGGRMEVDSQLGRGTSFTVWLPCLEYDALEENTNDVC